MVRNIAFYLQTDPAEKVTEQPLWSKTVNEILNEDQLKAYEQAVKKQERFLRKAAVERFLAKLEIGLFLSEKQREELRPLLDEVLGDFLTRYLKLEDQMRVTRSLLPTRPVENSPYVKKFKYILTKDQLDEWKRKYEPLLESLKLDLQRVERAR